MRRYAVVLTALGALVIAFGCVADRSPARWAMGWLGASFIAVGMAYARRCPRAFGKRDDGRLAIHHVVALLPYLGLTYAIWHLARWTAREPPASPATPGLWLARRLWPSEVPPDLETIVDLTAELAEPEAIRKRSGYRAFPILDGGHPSVHALSDFLRTIPRSGTVLFHCAQGHGRTAMVACCWLLEMGTARTHEAAEATVVTARPGAMMNRGQRDFVRAYAASLRVSSASLPAPADAASLPPGRDPPRTRS
jgi:protein-tyrosine phosphatase